MGLRPADAARLGIDHAPTVPADVRAAIDGRAKAQAAVDGWGAPIRNCRWELPATMTEMKAEMEAEAEISGRSPDGVVMDKHQIAALRRGPRRTEREQAAQEEVVRALRAGDVLFAAVPNGGARSEREGAAMQRAGVQAGFPDLLIFNRPTVAPADRCPTCWRPSISYDGHGSERREERECLSRFWGQSCEGERRPVGVALEMKAPRLRPKTARHGRWSGARPEQRRWLADLEDVGWVAIVAYGADDALRQLREVGYQV